MVAELYPRSRVLTAAAASAATVLDDLANYPVVHFATHAVPSAGEPRLSYLVLADGPLYAHQIAERELAKVQIVVLSACTSGRDDEPAGEGLTGLSQAFLEAGASAVVGTLWPVEDSVTVPLVAAFHRYLLSGSDPASALRAAKLDRLREGDPVAGWAAFEIIGATTQRRETL